MTHKSIKKGRVGSYECWLVGKMAWEVRHNGVVVAHASSMNECFRAAEKLNGGALTAYYDDRAASGHAALTAHR